MSSRHAWRSLRFWFDALFHPEPLEALPPDPAPRSDRRGFWSLLFAIEPLPHDAPEPEPRRLKLLRYLLLPESLERSTERDESARR